MVWHSALAAIFLLLSVVIFCRELLCFTITANRARISVFALSEKSYSKRIKDENSPQNSVVSS